MNDGADESIAGLPLDEAADAAVERGDAPDRETARAFLSEVAEDGVVGREGINEALGHASKVVSTPETRFELAATSLEDAREAAGPDADRPIVRMRLEQFDARLETVEDRVERLGEELRGLVERRGDEDSVYELAKGVRQLEAKANECQRAADELARDLAEFVRWLGDAEDRYHTLREDADELDRSLDRLAAAVDGVVGGDGQADPDDWLDAAVQHRVLGLAHADLRWELEALDAWAAEDDASDDAEELSAELDDRLDELAGRRAGIGDRLDDATTSDDVERRLAAVEDDLDALEPPIDWAALEATLDEHRAG